MSYHTVNGYLDYLAGAFLIRMLPPFHVNFGKRLVKSRKVYWRDSGLLHALLNVSNARQLLNQPWVGASWEGFVIEQALNVLGQCGQSPDAYFLRTSDQREIDLLLDFGDRHWAVEIKLMANPSQQDMDRLNRLADTIGAEKRFLVSQIRDSVEGGDKISCNFSWLLDYFEQEFR